ncbi:UNVERIFIED_CONTAM: putative mitochondrial protein [Sesamum angustifolium]|uniref:Mitochondrial protein n=1 Tax=Sesamum angustifolium TaxID=2727405 RepID=A0AAW2L3X0_9LAMI
MTFLTFDFDFLTDFDWVGMALVAGGSSPPLRSYRDAVVDVAVRPPPPPVSFDTTSFQSMGMLTQDHGMKVLTLFFRRNSSFVSAILTEIGLGFGTEVFIQLVIYERLPKYFETCKHLGHTEDECYEKLKSRGPSRPIERDDQRASDHADLQDVDGRPGASSSGVKGTEDAGVEVELHDMVLPLGRPDPMLHGEAVDGGTGKDILVSQSTPDAYQGVEDVATCSSEPVVPVDPLPHKGSPRVCVGRADSCVVPPAPDSRVEQPVCVENLIPDTKDVALCPPGEGILQSDPEDMTKRVARHRQGRLLGNEPGAHSASSDRRKVVSPPRRIVTQTVYAKCDTVERRALWDALRAVSVGASLWIVGGDFNIVLSSDERLGARPRVTIMGYWLRQSALWNGRFRLFVSSICGPCIPSFLEWSVGFLENPTQLHLQLAKRVLKHLQGTTDYGIFYKKGGSDKLTAYTDSDYVGDLDDRKNTSGNVFLFSSGAASWSSKKQPIVSLSTTEAEFIAAVSCSCQAIWLTRLLMSLDQTDEESIVIHYDSSSAIKLSKNPVMHGHSKHIDVRFHFL